MQLNGPEFVSNTVNTARSLMREAVLMSGGKLQNSVLNERVTEMTKDLVDAVKKRKEEGETKNSPAVNAMGVRVTVKVMLFYIDQIKALLQDEEVQDDTNKKDKYASILDKSIRNKDRFMGWLIINCSKERAAARQKQQ
jgi:hypothetical protein